MNCDVAVIGGGPAGATVATLIRKYNPEVEVAIFEAERFPRDHVGESLLPVTPRILDEMGCWDKVEAANFPVKIGASYKWGPVDDPDLWHNYFIPKGDFQDEPRPAKYVGQRQRTAFQVDRSVYDKILLDHAAEMGCKVFEETRVVKVDRTGDRVDSITVKSPSGEETLQANYFVDASGTSCILRNAMGVEVDSPTSLRNIAIWDYWQNAEWAREIGIGGTMVQVMSFGWGWIWFIPMSPTRTSVGVITSAEHYKKTGMSTEELYLQAISEEPLIRDLVANATREHSLKATKDWSFVADRLCGENWFLAGDVCGFADPILAAGVSLAHMGARRVAFSILELLNAECDPNWVRNEFDRIHRSHIGNHIRFADYWYSANGKFTDLQEYCQEIARDSGLTLNPDDAFQWLGTGGFTEEISGLPFAGTYRVSSIKAIAEKFGQQKANWAYLSYNLFDLDLAGAEEEAVAVYEDGRVWKVPCYRRGSKTLPLHNYYGVLVSALKKEREIRCLSERIGYEHHRLGNSLNQQIGETYMEALEVLVTEGWVKASHDPSVAMVPAAVG